MGTFFLGVLCGFLGAFLPLHFVLHPAPAPWGEESPPRFLKLKIWLLVVSLIILFILFILIVLSLSAVEMEKVLSSPFLLRIAFGAVFGALVTFLISDHIKNRDKAWGDKHPLYATGSLVAILVVALGWPYFPIIARHVDKIVTPWGSVEFGSLKISKALHLERDIVERFPDNLSSMINIHEFLKRDIKETLTLQSNDPEDPFPGRKYIFSKEEKNIGEQVFKFYIYFFKPLVECAMEAKERSRDSQIIFDNVRPVAWQLGRMSRLADAPSTSRKEINELKINFVMAVKGAIDGMSAVAPQHCGGGDVPGKWPEALASPAVLAESLHFHIFLAVLHASMQNHDAAIGFLEAQKDRFGDAVNYNITLAYLALQAKKEPDIFLIYFQRALQAVDSFELWLKRATADVPKQLELDLCGAESKKISDEILSLRKRIAIGSIRFKNLFAYYAAAQIAAHPNPEEFSDWLEIASVYADDLAETVDIPNHEEWKCLPDLLLPRKFSVYKATTIDTIATVRLVQAALEFPIDYAEIENAHQQYCQARRLLLATDKDGYKEILQEIDYHIQQANTLLGRDPRRGC